MFAKKEVNSISIETIIHISLALFFWNSFFCFIWKFLNSTVEYYGNPFYHCHNFDAAKENFFLFIFNLIVYIVIKGNIKIFLICCPISFLIMIAFAYLTEHYVKDPFRQHRITGFFEIINLLVTIGFILYTFFL